MTRQRKLFAFPLRLRIPNGYWDGLYGAIIQKTGVIAFHNDFRHLFMAFGSDNVVHIHWPTVLYASRYRWLAPLKLIVRLKIIFWSRLRGDRVVWTAHNYQDHEFQHPWLEKMAAWSLAHLASAVIVHSEAGRIFMKEKFGRTHGVFVVPHINYVDFHGPRYDAPDHDLMQQFGLRVSDKVFLSLGSIRPYKNYEALIDLFNELPPDVKLIIAGKSFSDEYLQKLKSQVRVTNILFHAQSIPGDDLPKFFSLARCSVFAFREVLTSGSVVLSLSYAVPVIVPDAGDLHYIIQNGVNGFRYQNAHELRQLVTKVFQMSFSDWHALRAKTFEDVLRYNSDAIGEQTLSVYQWS